MKLRVPLAFLPILLGPTVNAQTAGPADNAGNLSVCEYVAQRAAIANVQQLQGQTNSPFRQDYTIQNGYFDIDGDGAPETLDVEIKGNHVGPGFAYGVVERGDKEASAQPSQTRSPEQEALENALYENHLRSQARGFAWLPFNGRIYGINSARFALWQPQIIEAYSQGGAQPVCVLESKIDLDEEQIGEAALCEQVSSASWDQAATRDIADDALKPTENLNQADIARLFDILERRANPDQAERLQKRYTEQGRKGLPSLGDSVGALIYDGPTVLNIDWDNDGDEDRLTILRIDSGSASGCSSSYWELLPNAQTGQIDEEERNRLLDLQGVARDDDDHSRYPICWKRNSNWRIVQERAYLETVGTLTPQSHAVSTMIDGKAEPACRSRISLSFDVIFDRARDTWPDDVRANAAVNINTIKEQPTQETLPK